MRYLVCRKVDGKNQCSYANPYAKDNNGMRVWHETFEIAYTEAERLCKKENDEFVIFAEMGVVKPSPKTIFQDYRN